MSNASVNVERRQSPSNDDRRAVRRGGRRDSDAKKAWYRRQTVWLTAVSLLYVGWRRMKSKGRLSGTSQNTTKPRAI
jgi:hypothetical protein